jgi:hypothetical protein
MVGVGLATLVYDWTWGSGNDGNDIDHHRDSVRTVVSHWG